MNLKDLDLEVGKTEFEGMTIDIHADPEPESPREWSNLGTMYCDHRRYNLGDKNAKDKLRDDIRASAAYQEKWEREYFWDDNGHLSHLAEKCGFVILPLFLYDHSGITMNTTGFACPWDSGQVGIIWVTKETAYNELGVSRLTTKGRKRIEEMLRAEVATYDQFLRGDVWGWMVEDEDGHLDGCWGYFDLDDLQNDVRNRLPDILKRSKGEESQE